MWMDYTQSQEVSSKYQMLIPLWVQLAKQSNKGGRHPQSCPRVGLCFHTHIALEPWVLWMMTHNCPRGFGCIEGDQPIVF